MARKPAAPRQPETATATRAGEADREARYQFSAIAEQPASLVRLRSARHGSGGAAEGLTILTNLTVPCTDRRWPVGLGARGRRAFRMGGRGIWRGCPFCEACLGIAAALLRQWRGAEPVLHEVSPFYRIQLHRHS